jgi:methylmalonyl-CoA epimerase
VFGRIDHIGVAVEDIDAAIALYEGSFEMELAHRETVESQGVEAVLLDVGDGHVELLAPLGPDTPVGKYMAKNGAGLHHVAYAVDDIDATLEKLAAAGLQLIDSEPRVGIRDSRVAFLHPRSTGGVLTEIVEPAGGLMADAQRVEIGFEGGQVISTRISDGDLKDLRARLEQGGWYDLPTEDGTIALYLGKVQFLRVESGEHRVGFGLGA